MKRKFNFTLLENLASRIKLSKKLLSFSMMWKILEQASNPPNDNESIDYTVFHLRKIKFLPYLISKLNSFIGINKT